MSVGLLFLSITLGLYYVSAYLGRRRYVPTLAEIGNDVTAFNHGLELELASRSKFANTLRRCLQHAGFGNGARLSYLAMAMLAACAIGWQVGDALLPGLITKLGAAVGFAALPVAAVVQRAAARDQAISAQLPRVLSTVIPPLRSGTRRVEDCLREFVREQRVAGPDGRQQRLIGPSMAPPLGPELFAVYYDLAFGGVSLQTAVQNSLRRIDHQGYEDLMIGLLAATQTDTPAKELDDLRTAVEKERSAQREVAGAVSMIRLEAVAVPAMGLAGLIVTSLIMPESGVYLAQPGAQIVILLAWLLGIANMVIGTRLSSLRSILRHIEI